MKNKNVNIPEPTPEQVEKYLEKWCNTPDLVESEKALQNLFEQTYPKNNNLGEILIKISALDVLYSAGIRFYSLLKMAKHIKSLSVDTKFSESNLGVVKEISLLGGKKFYAFATKYCSFHWQDKYPKYDSNVDKVLRHFQCVDNFFSIAIQNIRIYEKYKEIIDAFKTHYKLSKYSYTEIDHYLYQLGKEYFPKK